MKNREYTNSIIYTIYTDVKSDKGNNTILHSIAGNKQY